VTAATPTADPLAPLLDALAARLAPLVASLVAAELAKPVAPIVEGLVDKRAAAQALGTSQATLDRLAREGLPYERVGTRRRFDVQRCRSWLAARGKRPTTRLPAERRDAEVDVDVDAIAHAAGLRRHAA
jgi:hypothetical protein